MASNTYVFTSAWFERVHRFVAFFGQSEYAWTSDLIKPSCSVVPVRGVGPNEQDVLYVGTGDGWLYKLSFNEGTVLAKMALAKPVVTDPVRGIAYADGVVYCTAANGLYAVKPSVGPLWHVDLGDVAWGTPAVADGIVYAGLWDAKLYAVNAADGSILWISQAAPFFASTPVVVDGVVYVQASSFLLALKANDGAVLWEAKTDDGANFWGGPAVGASIVYASAWGTPSCYAFKTADGTKFWSTDLPGVANPPIFYQGALFLTAGKSGSTDTYLYKLNGRNGSVAWVSPIPVGSLGDSTSVAAVDKGGQAPPNVFVTSGDQHIYAFAVSDGWFAWKAKIAEFGGFAIDPVWSDDPLELPLKMSMPSAFLERFLARGGDRGWHRPRKPQTP